jgi:hypothetical protein
LAWSLVCWQGWQSFLTGSKVAVHAITVNVAKNQAAGSHKNSNLTLLLVRRWLAFDRLGFTRHNDQA